MMRVISSPSSSTTGLLTLIFAMSRRSSRCRPNSTSVLERRQVAHAGPAPQDVCGFLRGGGTGDWDHETDPSPDLEPTVRLKPTTLALLAAAVVAAGCMVPSDTEDPGSAPAPTPDATSSGESL